ncbi:hypothetical protein QJS04_geneDACA005613 [Acorus gramineus]|uniref:Uncharacterized protein n=1 Tax=Acorus gramineus TaxID=55184 RepID=A0AAV9A4L7_ACOGR|nr:hypothetical protein QJS04_geneDACA005613 [Acorus gramineus]
MVTGDEGDDEGDEILPVIYEDKDDSEEEEEGDNDTMEMDQETDEERGQGVVFDSHESDASDVMSD